MDNGYSTGSVRKYALAILFTIIFIFSLSVPGRNKLSALIAQSLIDKSKGEEVKDPILKNALALGMLNVYVESKIVESNYLIFKIFTIHDASIVNMIWTQTDDKDAIKFIGVAGQLISLAPNFDYSSKPNLKSEVVTNKETEVYIDVPPFSVALGFRVQGLI